MMADFEGRLSPSCLEDSEDETLDPRIQVELERLNKASEEINRLELELDDARASFRQSLTDSTHRLDGLAKKLGSCVEKARPYYDARVKAKEVHVETQKAAYMYERACSMHEAAKEMVQLAEQGYMQRDDNADHAWQEMLNHATMKVNDAEMERLESEKVHRRTTQKFQEAEELVQRLQKDLKRAINKSKLSVRRSFLRLSDIANQFDITLMPYFEMKAKFNQMMEDQKKSVNNLEESVLQSKKSYSNALHNLEEISEEIHRQRLDMKNQAELGVRGAGVGSESPSPPPMRGKDALSIDGTVTKLPSSCNLGETPESPSLTPTSSVDQVFTPPSVIHSSAEKSRRQSYRDAIEAGNDSGSGRRVLDSIDEDTRVNLDDEYMSLPRGKAQQGTSDSESSRSSQNSPREVSSSGLRQQNDKAQLSSLSTTRGKSAKLKGLILVPVGAGQDPLRADMRIQTKSPTKPRSLKPLSRHNTEPLRSTTDISSHNTANISNHHHARPVNLLSPTSPRPSPQATPKMEKVITPGSEKSFRRLLKVPSSQDFDEGSISDTDSIASGPMLDDDQVEFLTMDFTEQRFFEDEEDESEDMKKWRRLSLPATMTQLESYIRRVSQTTPEDEEEDTTIIEHVDQPQSETQTSQS